MKLYTEDNTFKEIDLKDESYRLRSISGEHNITLLFDLPEFYEFPIGTFCEFQGQRYTLLKPQNFRKINSYHYEYTLVMESSQGLLNGIRFKELVSKKVKFTITAKPQEYLRLLVDNMNFAQGSSDWQVGNYLESAEKLIAFNHQSCMEALQLIAQTFNTEWEIVGKTIHLKKVEYNKEKPLALKLSYGKGNGVRPNIVRNSENHRITRLYIQGGERNIDAFKYGNDTLLLPKNYTTTYEGKEYRTDANGLYLERTEQANYTNEASLDLTHIYPKRVGTVTSVVEKNVSKNLFDFEDNTIPANLDYNAHIMNGQKLSVIFESGMLSGREFDVIYKHSEKRFEIVPKDEDGRMMPDSTFKPVIGDKYAVFGMMLPNAYISDTTTKSGASFEMLNEALKYFHENEQDKFSFSFELDLIWAKKNWINVGGKIVLGGYVNFSDPQFLPEESLIRIVSIKDYINNPECPIIELSNEVVFGKVASIFGKIKENEVIIEKKAKEAKDFTKRRFRDMEETEKLIQNAFSHFGKSINPATIRTMQLMVGDASLQFRFVVNRTQLTEIPIGVNYNDITKQLHVNGGVLQHLTLGIDSIKPNRNANEYKFWNVTPFISSILNDPKPHYLYIKANKSNEIASFILSEDVITLEQISGYYHFLVGMLNSEFEGSRGFAKMYGITEILPGQITTRKIASTNGQNYINLGDDEINIVAKVRFTDNSPAINQVKNAVSPDLLSLESRVKLFSEQKITESNQQSQQAINQAKQATENYVRQQNELTKQLAIAHADGKVSEAEQRQIANATQKLQEAKTYAEQKVNELQVGGRNLIYNSRINESSTKYGFATRNVRLEPNQTYTLSANGRCNNVPQGKKLAVYIYTPDWSWSRHFFITETTDTTRSVTFQIPNSNDFWVSSYYYDGSEPRQGSVTINWYKLEKGNKATDWSPTPEEIENKMANIRTDLETALKNARELLEAEDRNIKSVTQKLGQKMDFLSDTKINGNTVATGAVMVGNSLGGNAGINGSGLSANDVRFWAGSSFANRANASYRVLDSGDVYASKLHALNGCKIGDFEITSSGLSYKVFPNSEQGVRMFYDSLNFYGNSNKTFHKIGTQVFSASSGTSCFSFVQNAERTGVGSLISLGKEVERLPITTGGLGQYINCPQGLALHLEAEQGTALHIKDGSVLVNGHKALSINVQLGAKRLTFLNGILVAVSQ
ncbi:hypothetical protein CAPN004_10490 [Capnocytophaga cynodegmi]|uniref:hypothetical protein n=1 Tax=Capnocytophaga cynodegmi TaxID=28189 RepID=UPI001AC62DC1|nr:hypothetical protein [Capnocytophaga cynodegmi]GIM52019.1 hypothetical protein CAPN004_10490 [Capnocytophaga cynodegmi]